ncbi:cell motility mediator [Phlyctochytrium arcticum]|nr:cell motility mediator [Phlyctochytrium arcticum]
MVAIRAATHAGSWYSGSGPELSQQLDDFLAKVPPTSVSSSSLPIKNCRAVIAPHAGYSYSGPAAAYAYKCVDASNIQRVFILGPSHHVYLNGCALSKCEQYATPLGNLNVDKEVVAELKGTKLFSDMSHSTDEDEHSLEMHLPYIHKIMSSNDEFSKDGDFTIVPILVGAITPEKEKVYGELLAPYLADPTNLFVVSSDFCHWGTRFKYTYKGDTSSRRSSHDSNGEEKMTGPPKIYECIEKLDKEGMSIIETMKPTDFTSYLERTKNTICGRHPIGVLLCAVESLTGGGDGQSGKKRKTDAGGVKVQHAELKFVHYAQSSKVKSERDSSVSYASAYLCLD